ncbi:MAG TPA: hypothetical protein DGH68_01050 [Bacteroidetes bacterium]|jgi:hypothetical protein|nr:hypothetical protein [Bacteroidota bacterium]
MQVAMGYDIEISRVQYSDFLFPPQKLPLASISQPDFREPVQRSPGRPVRSACSLVINIDSMNRILHYPIAQQREVPSPPNAIVHFPKGANKMHQSSAKIS